MNEAKDMGLLLHEADAAAGALLMEMRKAVGELERCRAEVRRVLAAVDADVRGTRG